MRIFTLSNTPLDPGSGSGYIVCGYVDGLRKLGAEVTAIGPEVYEPLARWRRAIGYRQALGMARAARKADCDIIEYYGAESWLSIALMRRRARRPLLVCHSNGIETHATAWRAGPDSAMQQRRRWFQPNADPLYARAFRGADAIVTVSQFDAEHVLSQGYKPSSRVLAIENPLPDSYLGRPMSLDRAPVIGYCGAWLPHKGVERIVAEISSILNTNPAWRLLLVGVGDEFRKDEIFAPDLRSRVDLYARASRTRELPELYSRMRILVMPSFYESFGLVAAEGMACGCALVATRVGFGAALRPDEEAVIIEQRPGALERAIERLIDDDALRRRIATAGHRRVQSLQWPRASQALYEAYARWLAEREDGACRASFS